MTEIKFEKTNDHEYVMIITNDLTPHKEDRFIIKKSEAKTAYHRLREILEIESGDDGE